MAPDRKHGDERDAPAPPRALIADVRARLGRMPDTVLHQGLRLASRRRRRILAPLVAAVVCATAAAVVLLPLRERTLSYRIAAGERVGSDLVARTGEAQWVFDEGSTVVLSSPGRAAVERVTRDGAELRLHEGHARLAITPRPHGRWAVTAGPFRIDVLGTVFSVDWHEPTGRFEVALAKGSVRVSGPPLERDVQLGAGQHLVIDVPHRRVDIQDVLPRPTGPDDAIEEAPAIAPTESKRRPRRAETKAPAPETPWTVRVGTGDFAGVVAAAEAMGLDTAFSRATIPDLVALADSARYRRRNDVAKRTLSALRTRAPGSQSAGEAAFQLGRLAEAEGRDAEALDWYAHYLDEAPRGAFVQEASGRRMEALARTRGRAAARSPAEEHLRRFPNGNFAESARALLTP